MADPNLGARVLVRDYYDHRGALGTIRGGSYAHGYQVQVDADSPGHDHPSLHPLTPGVIEPVAVPAETVAQAVAAGEPVPQVRRALRAADDLAAPAAGGRCPRCVLDHPAPAKQVHFVLAGDLTREDGAPLATAPCPDYRWVQGRVRCPNCRAAIEAGDLAEPAPPPLPEPPRPQ